MRDIDCDPALTVLTAVVAATEAMCDSELRPLESMAVTSSTPGVVPPPRRPEEGPAAGAEPAEPKPTYLPPWFGGRWSGLLAFSCAYADLVQLSVGLEKKLSKNPAAT